MLPPPPEGGSYVDLRPLDTERRLMLVRMRRRNDDAAMPHQGTTQVDAAGVALIERWVQQMTPERGYPPPAPRAGPTACRRPAADVACVSLATAPRLPRRAHGWGA